MDIQQQSERLLQENRQFKGTGGVSQENRQLSFQPAFMDELSGDIQISHLSNGVPASYHSLQGLPDVWVRERDETGRVVEIKSTIISGFVRLGEFFTRDETAEFVAQSL